MTVRTPEVEHQRYLDRNKRAANACADCGAPIAYSSQRCSPCNNRRTVQGRKFRSDGWTRGSAIEALRAWAAVHGGEAPRSDIVTATSNPRCPSKNVVMRLFGSWNAGIQVAGLQPRNSAATPSGRRSTARESNRNMVTGGMSNTRDAWYVHKSSQLPPKAKIP